MQTKVEDIFIIIKRKSGNEDMSCAEQIIDGQLENGNSDVKRKQG